MNLDIEIIEKCEALEGKGNEPVDYQNTKLNSRNLIRAAMTKNYKLFENCINKDYFMSSLFERWGPANNYSAFDIIIKNNDKKMLNMFL
mmetsp:Transcript_41579/g.36958  ORF Transcript_41579/g.36958 Transcript_41579/m.36958 type:complete len:89 (+) Transcript_41579:848-1114(+)